MSVEYKLVPTKNNKSRIVSRSSRNGVLTSTRGREDNSEFSLYSKGRRGRTQLYIRLPREDGSGLDEIVLNGTQLRTLNQLLSRHYDSVYDV